MGDNLDGVDGGVTMAAGVVQRLVMHGGNVMVAGAGIVWWRLEEMLVCA